MPRKPLVIFIEGLFWVATQNYKRFSEYGDRCKAPFQAAWKLFSTSCISSFPHLPLVVAFITGNRLLFHGLAVGAFTTAPLRSGNYVRTSLRTPTLHYACIPASTSAPRGISIPLLTPYIPFPQSYPCHFPMLSSPLLMERGQGWGVAFVPAASKPRKNFMQWL